MTDFRKYKPEVVGEIDFHLPNIETSKFSNISLYHVTKGNLPICQLEIIIDCGSKLDPLGKEGLTHLTAMMLDEGAGKYTSLQLSEEFEKIGSIFSISSDKDAIQISVLSLEEYIDRSIELISLVLLQPTLAENDFEREKKKLIDKILQSKDNPSNVANEIFDKIIYHDSGYSNSIIGNTESVSSISLDDVIDFHKNVLLNKTWSIISVGSFNNEKIREILNRYLRNDSKQMSVEENNFSIEKQSNTQIYIVDHKGAAQTELMIGHISTKRNDGDYFFKHLLNSVLGGQFTSRINLNLREDKGYTYGAGSSFNYNQNAGAFYVSTSVQSEVTGNAVKEILYELNRIKDGVTEEELDFAKSSLIKRFPSQFETYSQVANNISNIITHNLQLDYYNSYITKINNSTIEQVNKAGIEDIQPDNLAIVCVGNANIIEAQLKQILNFEMITMDKNGNRI